MRPLGVRILLTALLSAPLVHADDFDDYVSGLRDYGYTDIGIELLEERLKDHTLSADQRAGYEFDVAAMLLDVSRSVGDLAAREQALRQAQQRLEAFIGKHPGNARRAEALAELASIELARGRLKVVQAQTPSYSAQAAVLADEARNALRLAAKQYDEAHAALAEQFNKLPLPLEDSKSALKIKRMRDRAFKAVVESRFQSAYATFLLGDSYKSIVLPAPPESDALAAAKARTERRQWDELYVKHVAEAEKKFESIFEDYRQVVMGAIGRLWQARCIAARGDHRRAKGIFDEVLGDKDRRLAFIHRQAFYFQLISLAAQNDSATLVARADEWMRANPRARNTNEFLGVELELARAHVALSEAESIEKKKADHLQRANDLFEALGKIPNEFQGLARREQLKLEGLVARTSTAKTYQQFVSRASAKLDAVTPGMSAADRTAMLKAAKDLLEKAVAAATDADPAHQGRMQLAFVEYQLGEFEECAKLAEEEARSHSKGDGASQGVSYALAARQRLFEQAVQRSSPDREATALAAFAQFVVDRWAADSRGDEARMALARLEVHPARNQNYARAVELLEAVPPKSPFSAEALSQLGRTYLDWSRAAAAGDEALKKRAPELRAAAKDRLKKASAAMPAAKSGRMDAVWFLTDLVLAEALVEEGDAKAASPLLKPLVERVEKDATPAGVDDALRIATIVAGLQADVQLGDVTSIERLLEAAGRQRGQEKTAELTRVFVDVARSMKDRLELLRAKGDDEAGRKLEEAFEAFLNRIADREAGQSLQSLAFVGTAFVEIRRLEKAQQVLKKALELAAAAPPSEKQQVVRVKLAWVRCLSAMGQHDEAITEVDRLIEQEPKMLEAAQTRARILAAGGQSKAAQAQWSNIINRTKTARPPEFYEALYQYVELCRVAPEAERPKQIQSAQRMLRAALLRRNSIPEPWRTRLEQQLKSFE